MVFSDKLNIEKKKTFVICIKGAQDIIKQKIYSVQKYIKTITNRYRYFIDFRINDFV
jgi:hypothetical protein